MKIKSPILFFTIISIIFLLLLDLLLAKVDLPVYTDDLTSPYMYQSNICSFHGTVNSNFSSFDYLNCTCDDGFTYNPKATDNQIINKSPVQCNYEKKKRFIAFFLAFFAPIGLDHIYLGNYWLGILIMILCCTSCFGNCFNFAFPSEIAQKDYFSDIYNVLLIILLGIMLLWWILNTVLIATGIITDGYNIETYNDFPSLTNF